MLEAVSSACNTGVTLDREVIRTLFDLEVLEPDTSR